MTNAELLKWETRLADEKNHSATSCAFAQLIWNSEVSEDQQIRLLGSSHNLVRQAVSWAIADFGRDNRPMRHLLKIGPTDSWPPVRVNAIRGVKEANFLSGNEKLQIIATFSRDTDTNVRSLRKLDIRLEDLPQFERDVLDAILADDKDRAILHTQIERSEISVNLTGAGFYVNFRVDPKCPRVDPSNRHPFGGVIADIAGLEYGAGFLIFIEDGYISLLEGYSFDEPWPETIITEYKLKPVNSSC